MTCGKACPQCLEEIPGLRAEALIERATPPVGRFVPAKHRFTLLGRQRAKNRTVQRVLLPSFVVAHEWF